jgi:hypothetical protein
MLFILVPRLPLGNAIGSEAPASIKKGPVAKKQELFPTIGFPSRSLGTRMKNFFVLLCASVLLW